MVARCRVDSVYVLTKDSDMTGAQLYQYSSRLPRQCLYGCSIERLSAIEQFWWAAFNGGSDRILVDAVEGRPVAGVVEWILGEVLLDVILRPADQKSSSMQPVICRSVIELMTGMLW